jgi:transcriptional regulator with XRE-family HTH domain
MKTVRRYDVSIAGGEGSDVSLGPGIDQLRQALLERGWSGQELVDQIQKWAYDHDEGTLGLTRSYVSEWVHGKRGISRPYARRISGVLDIPIDHLIDRRTAGRHGAGPGQDASIASVEKSINPGVTAAGLEAMNINELAGAMATWTRNLGPTLSRRDLLFKLSTAFAVAAAAPLFDIVDVDERDRATHAFGDPTRLDEATIRHIEKVLQNYRRQGDLLGPPHALQTTMAQRQVVGIILNGASPRLRPRVVSAYAELTQLMGWLLFNLGQYRAAGYYYDQARTAAHEAENVDLATYVLCTLSHLATWQQRGRVGIDHAMAAQVWAEHSGNPRARAYAADVAARAYAADHRPDKCKEALDIEQEALAQVAGGEPTAAWWYFHDESFYWGTRAECHLKLGTPGEACEAAGRSLALVDPGNLHNYVHTLGLRAEALIQQGEVVEASRVVGDVARLTAVNDSQRMRQRIAQLREGLSPWERSQPLKELDELLGHYR